MSYMNLLLTRLPSLSSQHRQSALQWLPEVAQDLRVMPQDKDWNTPMSDAVRVVTIIVIINSVLIAIGGSGAWPMYLLLIHPQVGRKVGVVPVYPCVYYAHPYLQALNTVAHCMPSVPETTVLSNGSSLTLGVAYRSAIAFGTGRHSCVLAFAPQDGLSMSHHFL